MLYTKDDKLLLTTQEMADLFRCSYTYINTILNRFTFTKYRDTKRRYHINLNQDFVKDMTDFMSRLHTKKSEKILEILAQLDV